MKLKTKLSLRSSLIFCVTLCFIATSTYLLFKSHTNDLYKKKLLGIARLAGYFYLERNEVSPKLHAVTEKEFEKISNESVRLYRAHDKSIYIDDSLHIDVPQKILQQTVKDGVVFFNEGARHFVSQFYTDDEGDFIIVASGTDAAGMLQLATLRRMLITFCVLGLVIHYVLTHILARKTFQPLYSVVRQVNAIREDNLHLRIQYPANRNDELQELVASFNYFLDRLESAMMVQRNFIKHASHELKTPLSVLIGEIEVTLNQPRTAADYQNVLASLKQEGLHLKSIIESLLTLSSFEITMHQQLTTVRMDEIIWKVMEKKRAEYPNARLQVDFSDKDDLQELLIVKGNPELLFVAVNNIVDNAIKFSLPHPVQLAAAIVDGRLAVTVQDKGPGIAASEQQKIFDLFFRGSNNKTVYGHGIGLYLTKRILDLHHIQCTLQSQPDAGTTFQLLFPA